MIVIGADTHKQTHTAAGVEDATGEALGELTARASEPGFAEFVAWGRKLGPERLWAIEDCRHVSGGLERYLIASGERVVRVPPKLMAGARRSSRERGKSDSIDAFAVARAALREGVDSLPAAHLDERSLEIKLLADHREDLVADRSDDQRRLRWHLHDLWPELQIPDRALDRVKWLDRIAGKLRRAEQTMRVRIARELLTQIRQRTKRVNELERELEELVCEAAPQLLKLRGCATLTAAKLLAEIAGAGSLPNRLKAGSLGRRRADPGLLRPTRAPPPRPRRQPPAQLRLSPPRGQPGPPRAEGEGLPGAQASRRQVAHGGASLPQAPTRQSGLA